MKNIRLVPAPLALGGLTAAGTALAQQQGVTRTELQRHDLAIPGREAIQIRVDLDPRISFPLHSHPGEEII
ncbi:hypothetical protein J5837_15180 [Pseudoxanthomonas helianthi]|uniref:Cupin domain-containing protein n=1 Tax=Pseudoxanthomonas helianthi TaxID=1453541 RepID=A0A940X693_9GAMM|nr:hypothetical protein [Pseudoxanthomonas helianthi]MBP3985752.1 hypothetical protein [Pseudoxanthomonas helianthi]